MLFAPARGHTGGQAGPQRRSELYEDVYSDFDFAIPAQTAAAGGGYPPGTAMRGVPPSTAFRAPGTMQQGRPPGTQMGAAGGMIPGTAAARSGGGPGDPRPMTSVAGAGYQSKKVGAFDPLNQSKSKGPAPALAEKADNSPEEAAKEMERGVHKLLESSALAGVQGDAPAALERAKEADKKEKALCKHRERHGLVEQINLDLTYAVCFALATCYHSNGMRKEALREYSAIVKNKQYPQAGRLRANMGNIYFEQADYLEAIKCYRMALDQIPNTGKEIRFKIFRNIGTAFVRMGQYQDAIGAYETVMQGSADALTGFNLVLCYYALEDTAQMKKAFTRLVAIPIQGLTEEDEDDLQDGKAADEAEATGQKAVDGLRQELKKRRKEAENYILTAAKLLSPVLDEKDWEAGYDWVADALKADHEHVASQMEVEKALAHLRAKQFDKAIDKLKAFEKKDPHLRAMAATNLSFIYFLEGEFRAADAHADAAIRHDRYNAKALVNKGNCLFMAREYSRAKEVYLEAIGVEVDCVEAIYNLGLVNIQLKLVGDALQAFEKLHTILPTSAEVVYHIANLHQHSRDDLAAAAKWFNILLARTPTDPGVLERLGQIANKADDESQAYHYYLESYRHYPVDLDVISWLGVWYVKSELYEKAVSFFERAAQIQPREVKWRLMVASCHRRVGAYAKAVDAYERIHADTPDNLECLRYLVAMYKDLGRPYEAFQQKLARLDRSSTGAPGGGRPPQTQISMQQQQHEEEERGGHRGSFSSSSSGAAAAQNERGALAAPSARVVDRGASSGHDHRDDDNFGDADVSDLLA